MWSTAAAAYRSVLIFFILFTVGSWDMAWAVVSGQCVLPMSACVTGVSAAAVMFAELTGDEDTFPE